MPEANRSVFSQSSHQTWEALGWSIPQPSASLISIIMFFRLLFCFFATASLSAAQGLLDKKEKKVIPPEVQAERDANRSQIEVEGVMYPVYLYEEEKTRQGRHP